MSMFLQWLDLPSEFDKGSQYFYCKYYKFGQNFQLLLFHYNRLNAYFPHSTSHII